MSNITIHSNIGGFTNHVSASVQEALLDFNAHLAVRILTPEEQMSNEFYYNDDGNLVQATGSELGSSKFVERHVFVSRVVRPLIAVPIATLDFTIELIQNVFGSVESISRAAINVLGTGFFRSCSLQNAKVHFYDSVNQLFRFVQLGVAAPIIFTSLITKAMYRPCKALSSREVKVIELADLSPVSIFNRICRAHSRAQRERALAKHANEGVRIDPSMSSMSYGSISTATGSRERAAPLALLDAEENDTSEDLVRTRILGAESSPAGSVDSTIYDGRFAVGSPQGSPIMEGDMGFYGDL